MTHNTILNVAQHRYASVKARYPTEGRRKLRLRVLYESWPTIGSVSASDTPLDTAFETDADPFDEFLEDDEIGIVIRTDFSNDDAWDAFIQNFQASQKELLSDLAGGDSEIQQAGTSNADNDGDIGMKDASRTESAATTNTSTENDDSDSSSSMPDMITILDPSDPADRARFANLSNIGALRIFNDVDIRLAPTRPAGTKQISPQDPLIDIGGWQEIYTGKTIWIYDEQSNTDDCLRLVSQAGDFYGTATGDSWRARASHICELQFSTSYQGMSIDFSGLDKWDWNERVRNLSESGII
ncbi:hypothetical protein D9619_001516 [Psilocybe cf. subviscida]|uniref:Uncharacterized protein n=1 Tax=Psilocybe cf. subviscida TaxID=2480587 RepID=A0A8H5BHI9_9AGAR|nr:hypothetical protein D9619_001516 [Psilocybe cf. subviscida]